MAATDRLDGQRVAQSRWTLAAACCGAFSLFVLELFAGKFLLPRFGGAPAVWVSCLSFFQVALVAGYFFSHRVGHTAAPRLQCWIVAFLFILTALATGMIARLPDPAAIGDGLPRVAAVPVVLAATIGPAFFTLATLAPLLGLWCTLSDRCDRAGNSGGERGAYGLYVASNAGSFLALLAYPILIENLLGLSRQTELLGLLFLMVAVCTLAAGWYMARLAPPAAGVLIARPDSTPGWRQVIHWTTLAAIPASWLSSITTYATAEVAPIPLLWIVPLAIYLASFILVFSRRGRDFRRLEPAAAIVGIVTVSVLLGGNVREPIWIVLSLHGLALLTLCIVLHGMLVDTRPPAEHFTVFSLAMASGGALGGLFNALVAPLLFDAHHEFPLAVAAAAGMIPPLTRSRPFHIRLLAAGAAAAGMALAAGYLPWLAPNRGLWLVILGAVTLVTLIVCGGWERAAGIAVVLFAAFVMIETERQVRYRTRTFFGVLRVEASDNGPSHELVHGSIRHGIQLVSDDRSRRLIPLSYYHPAGPLGSIFASLPQAGQVGVAGLGVGTIAAYAKPMQDFVFFEIDPAVAAIACDKRWFSYLADTEGRCRIVIEDARLALGREPDRAFDLLVIDAFTGDAVPTHLLTREALNLYGRKLSPDGILALHISNRYLDLAPIVAALAADGDWMALDAADRDVPGDFARLPSRWMALTRSLAVTKRIYDSPTSPRWHWRPAIPHPHAPVWTDDRTSVTRSLLAPAAEDSSPPDGFSAHGR